MACLAQALLLGLTEKRCEYYAARVAEAGWLQINLQNTNVS